MVHGPWTLAVSQNKAFDLVCYFAKLLIRLKVRTEIAPMKGIEPTHPAPVLKDQGPWTMFQAPDFQTFMFD